ncbi:MAG: Gluconolactonase precursor [Planctomycetota bacterium]|jgi:sugar lactone lactonase YvrE/enterochelin esterase-like enzyme
MIGRMSRFLLLLLCLISSGLVWGQESYPDHPDSLPKEGVPKGEVRGPFPFESKIFPGTKRSYWVYVPAQYKPEKPACLFVTQDGLGMANSWRLPTVMDNLIHSGEMPVTIGLFIDHGIVPAPNENAQPRFNRSYEYDSLGDRYARFLIEEMIPEVKKSYSISDDPSDRAIGGASSGAICAFTVAWERPDQFRRVLSTIGTYVGLRGGDVYPTLIRKYESKPIRVFLQDGNKDLNIYAGDWWTANLDMLSSLKFAGYEVEHVWGEGGHNGKHGAAIMPDALRWLWKGWPAKVEVQTGTKRQLDLTIPGEGWKLVSEGHRFTEGPSVNAAGEVFFSDGGQGKIFKVGLDGKVSVFVENSQGINGLMFGPDGKLYGCQSGKKMIVRFDASGKEEKVCENTTCNDICVMRNGLYYTDPDNKKIWFSDFNGQRKVVDEGIAYSNGLAASPDQTLLNVADTKGKFLYSFQIQPDGGLAYKQTYGYLHQPDDATDSGADGLAMDKEGRLYVATRMGVQVMDQLGRCNIILEKPQPGWLANVEFGGPEMNVLYATAGDKVFSRKLNTRGVVPWQDPVKPPKPGL